MPITAKEYAQGGKVDQSTAFGLLQATAEAAQEWREFRKGHPEITDTAKLAGEARKIVDAAPQHESNDFLKAAGTAPLARGFATNLMDRSEQLDTQQHKEKGTNLIAYMDEAASAIAGLDKFGGIENAKKGNVPMSELNTIREKFSRSSEEHLSVKGTYLDDFLKTVQEDAAKDDKDKTFTRGVTVEPKEMGGNFLELLVKLIGMFLGIDLGSMMTSPGQTEPQKADVEKVALVSKSTEEKLNQMVIAGENLRAGKDIDKSAADVKRLAKDLGGQGSDKESGSIDEAKAKELGQQVLDDVVKVRTGQMKPETMGDELLKTPALAGKASQLPHGPDFLAQLPDNAIHFIHALAKVTSSVALAVNPGGLGELPSRPHTTLLPPKNNKLR